MFARPSPHDLERMLRGNTFKNCPITIANIQNTNKSFDPDIGSLCGKTVRCTPEPVVSDYIAISSDILDQHSYLEITADLMFVNKIPFIVTLGQRVKFTTIENLPNLRAPTLLKGIQ